MTEMKNDPRVKEANKREVEFMAEVIEESQKKKRRWADFEPDEDEQEEAKEVQAEVPSTSSSSTLERGAKRRTENDGGRDVEYDDEGTRITSVGAHLLQKAGGITTCDVALF